MATLKELEAALRNADAAAEAGSQEAAGDARAIAAEIENVLRLTPGLNENPTSGSGVASLLAAANTMQWRDFGLGAVQSLSEGGPMVSGPMTVAKMVSEKFGVPMPENPIKNWADNAIAENREADEVLMETWPGKIGYGLSAISSVAAPGASARRAATLAQFAKHAPALMGVSRGLLPSSYSGNAILGGLLGASRPTVEGESRPLNTAAGVFGGLLGKVIPGAIGATYGGAKKAWQGLFPNIDEAAASVLRSEADSAANLLTPMPSNIPGVARSLAEESKDAGIARLERNSRSTGKGWDAIDRQNNAARVSALESFAGDEASIAAATEARALATAPLRNEALRASGVDTSRLIGQLERMERAFEGRPSVQSGLAQVRSLLTKVTNENGVTGQDSVRVLDNVRKTINEMLSGKFGGDNAQALAGSRELMAVRNQLDRVVQAQVPVYGEYLDTFRAMSRPIDRMELGQRLVSPVAGSSVLDAVTGKQVLTPAAFSRQARGLDAAAQAATGFRKAKAESILEPQDFVTIRGVQDDLERRAFAATAGSGGGSPTFERGALQQRLAGHAAGRVPVLGAAVGYLREMGQARLESRLTQVLQNPADARAILSMIPGEDRRILEAVLMRAGVPIAGVSGPGAVPPMLGLLGPVGQNGTVPTRDDSKR